MKKTMKLALLMASTLTLSTISFATDVLSYSEDLFNKNMNQNIKSFIPKYDLNKITPAQKVFIEYFGTNQHFQNKQQSALMSRDKSLSTSVDLSNNCLIEDQGNLGACTANASAGALHATQVTQWLSANPNATDEQKQNIKNLIPALSRIFLYYNELGFEGSLKQGDLGASLSTAIMVLRMLGICPESMLAYDDNTDGKNIFDKRPSALCYRAAKGTKDTDPKTIHASIAVGQSDTVQNIKQALDNGYYVPFGFMVFQEFESDAVASNGIVPMPNVNSQSVGGHAVYAVGYDEATKRFKVANSWGTSWGDKGFFYLPYEYFTQQSADGSGPLVSEIYQIDHASNATVLLTSPKELLTEYTHITKLAGLAQKYNADMNEVYKIRSILQEMLTLAEFVHKVIDDASETESFATSTIHKAEDIAHKIGDEIRKIT